MDVFQNVLDTIKSVFAMIADFFKGLFGIVKGGDTENA